MDIDYNTSTDGWFNSTQAWSYWNREEVIEDNAINSDEDIRFKNYYRDFIDCHHNFFVINYSKRILFYKILKHHLDGNMAE